MGAFKVVSGSKVKNHIFPLHSDQNRFRTDCMSGPERSILGVLRVKNHLLTYLGPYKSVWATSFRSDMHMGAPGQVKGSKYDFRNFRGHYAAVTFPILVENGLFSLIFTDFRCF